VVTASSSALITFSLPNSTDRCGRTSFRNTSQKITLTKEKPKFPATQYPVPAKRLDAEIRAFYEDALAQSHAKKPLIDVRSPGEFKGEVTHMPEYPQEGVLRGGHIPGARSVPWAKAANPDGSFKSADELRTIYEKEQGLAPTDDVIAYCRIGERSSHTWFVLTYLLGFEKVRNYDGSWTEWGSAVRVPIVSGAERGEVPSR
jgi:thiosulfate/3-mercaptopyruvate sulfurtransferase